MATLNTLRTKGGVIVSIVIGIALLAFLVGDFAPRSCSEYTVGKINGKKIDYIAFSNEAEASTVILQTLMGTDALSVAEQDNARNMAWENYVLRYSYRPGFEKLGLWTSEAEQVDMVSGAYISPIITSYFSNPQTGTFDPALLRNFVSMADTDTTGRSNLVWDYLKQQMNVQRAMSKFIALVSQGLFVNDLELADGMANDNMLRNARVVSQPYSEIPDSTITVTAADLKNYYTEHQSRFKQQAGRDIEYVVFDLIPSQEDYDEAKEYIDGIASEFAETETPMQYATLNSQTAPDQRYISEAQVDASMVGTLWNKPNAVYGPVLAGDTYTLAREADSKMMPDTLGARHILLSTGQTALADSLVGVIKKGGDFAALSQEYSQDQAANLQGGDLGKFAPEQMIPQFSDALMTAQKGDVFTITTQYGIHVVEMTYKGPLVRKAQIAVIKYKVDPSTYTQQVVFGEASQFLVQAAGSYDNFKKAANDAAISKRIASIKNTDRTVNNIEDSRELVRWSFNGNKGEVSGIMEIDGDYIIAAITGVREEGIATLEEVADDIRPVVLTNKKADIIKNKMTGTTLEEAAAGMGAEIVAADSVSFGSFFLDNIGVESRLVGAIAATGETNRLSKPVQGNNGIFVFDVKDIIDTEQTGEEDVRVKLETSATSYIDQRLGQALTETSEIVDERVKYF